MFIQFVFIPVTQQRIPDISFITAAVSSDSGCLKVSSATAAFSGSCGNTPKAECHRCCDSVTWRHSSNVLEEVADSDWNDEDLMCSSCYCTAGYCYFSNPGLGPVAPCTRTDYTTFTSLDAELPPVGVFFLPHPIAAWLTDDDVSPTCRWCGWRST